ncbi:MAG: N-acetyltransferase family protein [Pseudolabrys sp.]
MIEALPDGGTIRKLWIGESSQLRDHLLRLDGDSRARRFGGGVSDARVIQYADTALTPGAIVYGFLIDGTLRGVAEMRRAGLPLAPQAEVAFSVETPWQSHGVGSALLERTLLAARNRGIKTLHMQCLADNRRMQQLAAKFNADLTFETGSVIGEVDPRRPNPLSLLREWVEDSQSLTRAMLDVQTRLLRAG